ncbi:galactokinase-like protein, partial [Leptotrombidium deliense]
ADNLKPGYPRWANYVKGVIANFPSLVVPFKALIVSSVPIGSGLSSSASLEVSTFTFLEGLLNTNLGISLQEKAVICQRAEHLYANVPCGLMDQLITLMGRENNALLIDCKSLETQLVEISDANISFLVCNSKVRHSLADSEYSSRRKVCEQVAVLLARSSLRDVCMRELETSKSVLTEQMYSIARHVITEISRTESAAEALKAKDYTVFGTLMTQSHISLRDDYKVSCAEVDELVEITLECDGVYGSRMTGAGFGGCTITLLKSECVNQVIDQIKSKYRGSPDFLIVKPTQGAQFKVL